MAFKPAQDARSLWLAQQRAVQTLQRATKALEGEARLMPLKGVLLNATTRQQRPRVPGDCDVLADSGALEPLVRRLQNAGFSVVDWSRDSAVATLRPGGSGALPTLDLHLRPAPGGYGALTTEWMFRGATEDTRLFGVPVWVPTSPRVFVHLVANAQRDQLHSTSAHVREDLRSLFAEGCDLEALASAVEEVHLRTTARLVLDWLALEPESSERERALRSRLALTPMQERLAWLRWRLLRPTAAPGADTLGSRLAARMASDRPSDWLRAMGHTAWGLAVHLGRRRRLLGTRR